MRSWATAFLSLYLVHAVVFAEALDTTPLAQVQAALEKLDATNLDDDWYFTMEVIDGEELQIIQSDPFREQVERRQLLTVNGSTPDNARLKEFREAEKKRVDDIDPETAGYRYMVDIDTLEPVEESDGYIAFSFAPRVKALEDSRDSLRGTLRLDTQTGQIEELEIHNTGKLSPAFSVTVDSYRLSLHFQQEQGENLLNQLESDAVGKVGFLKSFDSRVKATFSGYRRAGP